MAQQVVIDIIAETQKLNSGIADANQKLGGLESSIGSATKAAIGLASGLILREGVTFIKGAIGEAVDAEKAFSAANAVFKDSPGLIQAISSQADTLGIKLGLDNDYILNLAAAVGQRMPQELDKFSVALVEVGADIAAASGGTITLDGWLGKLAKAFATGEFEVKKLEKVFPGLTDATWKQVDALIKQGKEQDAMNFLIEEATKKYGGTAAEQVTATQKIQTAIDSLKEEIGKALMPAFEAVVGILKDVITFINQNKAVMLPLIGVVAALAAGILLLNVGITAYEIITKAATIISGLFTAKTVAQTAATGAATAAQTGFNLAMLANPITLVIAAIVALIAIIVLLVMNWDKVSKVLADVWKNLGNFIKDAGKAIGDWVGSVGKFLGDLWKNFTDTFNGIMKNVGSFIGDLIKGFLELPNKIVDVGVNIVKGLWNGISSMINWLGSKVTDFFGNLIPGWAKDMLGIKSPSKVFAGIGTNVVKGINTGISGTKVNKLPTLVTKRTATAGATNITINAGLGTDPYALGRTVSNALNKQAKVSKVVYRGGR